MVPAKRDDVRGASAASAEQLAPEAQPLPPITDDDRESAVSGPSARCGRRAISPPQLRVDGHERDVVDGWSTSVR